MTTEAVSLLDFTNYTPSFRIMILSVFSLSFSGSQREPNLSVSRSQNADRASDKKG